MATLKSALRKDLVDKGIKTLTGSGDRFRPTNTAQNKAEDNTTLKDESHIATLKQMKLRQHIPYLGSVTIAVPPP